MTDSIRRTDVEFAENTNFTDYNNFNHDGKSGEIFFPLSVHNAGKIGRRSGLLMLILFLGVSFFSQDQLFARLATEESEPTFSSIVAGETDFNTAVQRAKASNQNLLIYFFAEQDNPKLTNDTEESFVNTSQGKIRQIAYTSISQRRPLPLEEACAGYETDVLSNLEILEKLNEYIVLKLPIDATTRIDEENVTVLDLPQFEEMQGHPGLAVLDFEQRDQEFYGKVTGILPFLRAKTPSIEETLVFLSLPPGTLTQRTLIYAVRIHPDRPLSTTGIPEPILFREAKDHSIYQARTGQLGHQNFGNRSSRIAQAMGGSGPAEICAQSWSGEGLFEAAVGCVRAWRGSSGHWKHMKAPNRYYGYDMVRGQGGTWYATGLFVK